MRNGTAAGYAALTLWLASAGAQEPPAAEGLLAWYDATQLLGADDGGFVYRWPDSSGNGRVAAAVSTRFRPRLTVESKDGEPRAYVRFDGVDDFLAADGPVDATSATVFLVMRPTANTGPFRAVLSAGPVDRNDYQAGFNIDLGPWAGPSWGMLNVESAGARGVANLLASERAFGRFHVISIAWERGRSITCRVDGKDEGRRAFAEASMSLDRIHLGCRHYRNEPGPPYPQGFFEGDLAEVLIYGRALPENERGAVERRLMEKHSRLMGVADESAAPLRMLTPGFEVHVLPLDVSNINDMEYDDQGRLWLLGYDGRIHFAMDTDGDGVEDRLTTYWDRPTFQDPLALRVRPDGVYVSASTKISKIVDENGDGAGDREEAVVSGWAPPQNKSGGVDALGMAFDAAGDLYFALGCSDYTNAYLVKDGKAGYSLASQRGTIQKRKLDGTLETVCTGVRFPVSLAFNRDGELFATDQEGETWLPGGNPLDELLHIVPGRHYGFPPRHPEHLPDVFDEPAVETYGPQHQSTCGLVFNDNGPDRPWFGPPSWRGDAIVAGYSRGRIWRTKLAKDQAGFVAQTQCIAMSRLLLVDVALSPKGWLVVSGHSGQPDWGSGPTGKGSLFQVRYVGESPAAGAVAFAASPLEVRVAFPDGPAPGVPISSDLEFGEHVRAGDRYEVHRPGYESVRLQQLAPRRSLAVLGLRWNSSERFLSLSTPPHPVDVFYSATLRFDGGGVLDLAYDLSGVETRILEGDSAAWRGTLPHLSDAVNANLLNGYAYYREFEGARAAGRRRVDRTRIAPWMGRGRLVFTHSAECRLTVDGKAVAADPGSRGESRFVVELTAPIEVQWETDGDSGGLRSVVFEAEGDSRPRPAPLAAFRLPWGAPNLPTESRSPPAAEIAGGDWRRGRDLFYGSTAMCGSCHKVGGQGGEIGPDLSNLVHRDAASVLRDVVQPSAAINPDYVSMTVLLTNGEVLAGVVRPAGENRIAVADSSAKVRIVRADEIDEYRPSNVSIMPSGIAGKIGEQGMRDLLTYLTTAEPAPPASAGGRTPPVRTKEEVERLLAESPAADELNLRPLNVVLAAGPKDHGPGEHEYPLWQKRWASLLALGTNVRASTAFEWPEQGQFDLADVMVFYFWNHDWNRKRYEQIDRFLRRGGGLVVLHAATIADSDAEQWAERIGLAYQFGPSKFRHGRVTLEVASARHPITSGLPNRIEFLDETYWGVRGELSRVRILATAFEENEAKPILWTYEPPEGGRVFASVLGHYLWTFDDPVFRIVLLRGVAWAAGEPASRLARLALDADRRNEAP